MGENVEYQVDGYMFGSLWESDVLGFCEVLQGLCDREKLNIKIVPITKEYCGAINKEENIISDNIWFEAIDKFLTEKTVKNNQ